MHFADVASMRLEAKSRVHSQIMLLNKSSISANEFDSVFRVRVCFIFAFIQESNEFLNSRNYIYYTTLHLLYNIMLWLVGEQKSTHS